MVKTDARVILLRGDTPVRVISGVVTEIAIEEVEKGRPEISVRIEPRFSLARYRSNIKAFLQKSALDIVS
ncbi:MAG: hypothetical protein GY726_15110, partial [Proteobacteria bacterium]|nr:hypothetical protein [Pseudomonadota bacterium]